MNYIIGLNVTVFFVNVNHIDIPHCLKVNNIVALKRKGGMSKKVGLREKWIEKFAIRRSWPVKPYFCIQRFFIGK